MYNNLMKLMKEKKITQQQIGAVIGKNRPATMSNKFTKGIEFTFEEACKISDAFFPEYDIRYVFKNDKEEAMA